MKSSSTSQIYKYDINNLQGKFLVGSPNIYDNDIFSQSIILVTEHNINETKGIIINQILKNSSINDIFKIMTGYEANNDYNFNVNIFLGGPVNYNEVHILHSSDYTSTHTKKINSNISLTSNMKILEDIKNNKGPNNFIFVMGYTNWYKDQLKQEIDNNQWLIQESEANIIFFERNKLKWYMSLQKIGINPEKSYIYSVNETI